MLIEIHMIQNHSPANMNRDDLGAPKTCLFGGVPRARISSQCIKRSIRAPRNPDDIHNRGGGIFAQAMASHLGCRTQFFPWLVEQELSRSTQIPPDERRRIVLAVERIAASREKEGKKPQTDEKWDPRPKTPQLIHLGPGHAKHFVKALEELRRSKKQEYEYFLNPVVGFQEMVREYLLESELDDKERERIVRISPVIAKCRMPELLKLARGEEAEPEPEMEDGQPGKAHAKLIAECLASLSEGERKKLTKPATAQEKGKVKEEEPPKPGNMADFMGALKSANQYDAVDIALFGRMTTSEAFQDVEAAMQVAHAISTHAAVNETDYFTAVDDLSKTGGGAAYVDEAMYNSACFYKYFSLDWDQLVSNLAGPEPDRQKDAQAYEKWASEVRPKAQKLAAATLGHFIRAAVRTTPTGKQNSFAAHNPPDGVLVEIRNTPISYANAFARPAAPQGERDLISQSIAQLGQYIHDLDNGYGRPQKRFWFSPNLRYPLTVTISEEENGKDKKREVALSENNPKSLDDLITAVIRAIGHDWEEMKKVLVNPEVA